MEQSDHSLRKGHKLRLGILWGKVISVVSSLSYAHPNIKVKRKKICFFFANKVIGLFVLGLHIFLNFQSDIFISVTVTCMTFSFLSFWWQLEVEVKLTWKTKIWIKWADLIYHVISAVLLLFFAVNYLRKVYIFSDAWKMLHGNRETFINEKLPYSSDLVIAIAVSNPDKYFFSSQIIFTTKSIYC